MVRTHAELTPRARAKRDQIRAGAQRLFLERGFAGSSTDAIAREAGVSKQTLYAYYPGKESLLADVLERVIGEGLQYRLPDSAGEISPENRDELRQALVDLGNDIIEGIMQPEYVALIRIIVTESPRLPQLGNLFRSTVGERALGIVSGILQQARDGDLAQVPDLDSASRMFVGPLLTYAILDGLLISEGQPQPPNPERIEALVDMYMKSIS